MNEEEIIKDIINKEEAKNNPEILFQQYELFIKMADNISERREKTNNFYLTLITALFGLIGLLIKFNIPIIIGVFPLILIRYLSINWEKHINDYKLLNKAKFNVINHLENYLPAKGFTQEWELCKIYDYGELTKKDKTNSEIFKKFSEFLIGIFIILFIIQIIYYFNFLFYI